MLSVSSENEKTIGELTAPKELAVSLEFLGKTIANPVWGSVGRYNSSYNAISYKYDFSDENGRVYFPGILTKIYNLNFIGIQLQQQVEQRINRYTQNF
jgi:hypothetical protein